MVRILNLLSHNKETEEKKKNIHKKGKKKYLEKRQADRKDMDNQNV